MWLISSTFEPIRAGLTVYTQEPAGGRSLDDIVAAVLTTHPEAQLLDPAATSAGEPAQIIDGISGMMGRRRIYLIHNDFIYEITLVPLTQPGEFEEVVMAQRELLWNSVSSSFTWVPEVAGDLEVMWDLMIFSFHFAVSVKSGK